MSFPCINIPFRATTMIEASTALGSTSKNGPIHNKTPNNMKHDTTLAN